jgi:hypothetical protein
LQSTNIVPKPEEIEVTVDDNTGDSEEHVDLGESAIKEEGKKLYYPADEGPLPFEISEENDDIYTGHQLIIDQINEHNEIEEKKRLEKDPMKNYNEHLGYTNCLEESK